MRGEGWGEGTQTGLARRNAAPVIVRSQAALVFLRVSDVEEHCEAEDHQACEDEDYELHRALTSVPWCEKPTYDDQPDRQDKCCKHRRPGDDLLCKEARCSDGRQEIFCQVEEHCRKTLSALGLFHGN